MMWSAVMEAGQNSRATEVRREKRRGVTAVRKGKTARPQRKRDAMVAVLGEKRSTSSGRLGRYAVTPGLRWRFRRKVTQSPMRMKRVWGRHPDVRTRRSAAAGRVCRLAPLCEVVLDLLQRFPLRFRQEKGGGREVHDRAPCENEEHRAVAVLADHRKENGGNPGRDALV